MKINPAGIFSRSAGPVFGKDKADAETSATSEPRRTAATSSTPPPPPTRTRYLTDEGTGAPAPRAQASTRSTPPDPKFSAELEKALAGAMSSGYSQFLEQVTLLSEGISDRATLLKLALKSIKMNGTQLLVAIRERLEILAREKSEFEAALQQEAQELVASNQQVVQECARRDAEIGRQIEQLTRDRETIARQSAGAEKQIGAVESQVKATRDRFESAYASKLDELTRLQSELTSKQS